MRRFTLAVVACALLGVGAAAPAAAHTGTDTGMACAGITLELAGFPAGENQVTTTITIDGQPIDPVVSTFQGPAATIVVPLPPFTGTRRVAYQTSWTIDGGGQTDVAEVTITCGPGADPSGKPRKHKRFASKRWWWHKQQHAQHRCRP